MFRKRFPRPVRGLRRKLTFSYTLTSVVTFLMVELLALAIAFIVVSLNVSNFILNDLKPAASQAAPYFVHEPPDREALTVWLGSVKSSALNHWPFDINPIIFLAVVDKQGQTIASIGNLPVSPATPLSLQLPPQNQLNLQAVLNDTKGKTTNVNQDTNGTIVTVTPIVENTGNSEKLDGALVVKFVQPNALPLLSRFLFFILFSGTVVTTIAALAGLVFGYLNARGITRRLEKLSVAADRWSLGDFSALAHDTSEDELGQLARQFNRLAEQVQNLLQARPSEDELGQLARQFNRMAEQVQNLLQARQNLATLEERNRLARDLHDSVKQQIFAVGMQLGASRLLLKNDVAAAEVRLNEAQKLVGQAQQELTSLIRELRPMALEGKGLVVALRELATEWSQQTEVVANLSVEGTSQPLPLTVEEALFRVAQEALANVARHSKATLVQLILTITEVSVKLAIIDNRQGFELGQQGRLGVGLLSMQERMKALGGNIQVESVIGMGTQLLAYCNRLGIATSEPLISPVEDKVTNP